MTPTSDIEKLREWLDTCVVHCRFCERLNCIGVEQYHTLTDLCRILLDVCDEWQCEISVRTTDGHEWPLRKAIEECIKEISGEPRQRTTQEQDWFEKKEEYEKEKK